MIEPMTNEQLIAECEQRLRELPTLEQLDAWRPRTLDESIERTQLRGERLATERLLHAVRSRPSRG